MPKATFGKSCAKNPLLESHFLEKLHKNVTNDKVRFKGDYYLSISNVENRQSHIHIMTNHRENDLCYLVKKNNLHSKLYFIDKNKTSRELVSEFLQNYNKFNG